MNNFAVALEANLSAPGKHSESTVLALASWYTTLGRRLFVDAFEKETGLRISTAKRTDKALVEQAFPKNINEYSGKLQWENFYIANALIGLRQLDRLLHANAVPPGGEVAVGYRASA